MRKPRRGEKAPPTPEEASLVQKPTDVDQARLEWRRVAPVRFRNLLDAEPRKK